MWPHISLLLFYFQMRPNNGRQRRTSHLLTTAPILIILISPRVTRTHSPAKGRGRTDARRIKISGVERLHHRAELRSVYWTVSTEKLDDIADKICDRQIHIHIHFESQQKIKRKRAKATRIFGRTINVRIIYIYCIKCSHFIFLHRGRLLIFPGPIILRRSRAFNRGLIDCWIAKALHPRAINERRCRVQIEG